MNIGTERVNRQLYAYKNITHGKCFIVTDYQFIEYLPGFENNGKVVNVADSNEFFDMIKDEKVTDVMISRSASKEIKEHIINNVESGRYKLHWIIDGWFFVGIKAPT